MQTIAPLISSFRCSLYLNYARILTARESKSSIALRHHLTIISQDSDFERMRQVRELSSES